MTAEDLLERQVSVAVGDTAPWSQRLRSAWTRFIVSLIYRNPEAVATIRDNILQIWAAAFDTIKGELAPKRSPEAVEQYIEHHFGAVPNVDAARFLQTVIDNKRVGPTIFGMHWNVVRLESSIPLLTSDRPLDMPHGLANPNAYIALPVAPHVLFVAAFERSFGNRVGQESPTKIVKQVNKAVVRQAREYVWGVDDGQLAFVRKHIGAAPDRVILTDKQKLDSLQSIQNAEFRAKLAALRDAS